jgi:hypothetical protein
VNHRQEDLSRKVGRPARGWVLRNPLSTLWGPSFHARPSCPRKSLRLTFCPSSVRGIKLHEAVGNIFYGPALSMILLSTPVLTCSRGSRSDSLRIKSGKCDGRCFGQTRCSCLFELSLYLLFNRIPRVPSPISSDIFSKNKTIATRGTRDRVRSS